jgi:deazaflavin-dependent oxidoreductase (nitroreductase family)
MSNGKTTQGAGSAATRFAMRVAGRLHRGVYRWSGGKIGGKMGQLPILLLTTTGHKSGQARTWPLGYIRDGERLIIVASAGGEPKHPAWYLNLRSNPQVTIRLGDETITMHAETASGAERARLWERLTGVFPGFAEYQRKTTREIPVVILSKVTPAP